MSELLNKPYEISIWEDELVIEYWPKEDLEIGGVTYEVNDVPVPADVAIPYCEEHGYTFDDYFNTIQYFDENRVVVVGSNTMDTPTRAMEPTLKRNVNGTVSLSFYLYLKYYDEESDTYKENPFVKTLLINERKLKLNYDGEWYDCIIKTADEDSQANTLTVTTADLFINELSKTGFSLEFDTDLGNNIGTVVELGGKVVEGTEWEIGESDNFLERRSTNLYEAVLTTPLQAISLTQENVTITIAQGETVYAYYSSVVDYQNHEENSIQIIYDINHNYQVDKDRIILERLDDEELYTADEYLITPNSIRVRSDEPPADIDIIAVSYEFKGKKLMRSVSSTYDPITKKVVERYYYDKPIYGEDGNPTGETERVEAYMYYENKYYASSVVDNQLTNGEKFVNAESWLPNKVSDDTTVIAHSIYPSVQSDAWASVPIEKFHNYLRVGSLSASGSSSQGFSNIHNVILNEGLVSNLRDTTGFAKSDKYAFRISWGRQALHADGSSPAGDLIAVSPSESIKSIKIKDYKIDGNGAFTFGNNTYFNFNTTSGTWYTDNADYGRFNLFSGTDFSTEAGVVYYEKNASGEYVETQDEHPVSTKKYYYTAIEMPFTYCVASCQTSLSYAKMISGRRDYSSGDQTGWQIGVFIELEQPVNNQSYFIEGVQLFPVKLSADATSELDYHHIVLPGMAPDTSVTKTYYYYEKPNPSVQSEEDVSWIYQGDQKQNFEAIIEPGLNKFTKKRSITAKETNRFNLIQSLCETFECWAKFDVRRDEISGKVLKEYIEDDDGIYCDIRREKYIEFLEYIGKDNYAGFKYGINLKQITRNIASDQIVTKLIVKDNSNEHAVNGFCSIARATENPSRSNFILNTDYYIRQGMLSGQQWIADLYSDTNGNLGYYKKISEVKEDFDKLSIEKSEVQRSLDNLTSDQTVYQSALNEATEQRALTLERMYSLAGVRPEDKSPEQLVAILKGNDWKAVAEASDLVTLYTIYTQNISSLSPLLDTIGATVAEAEARVNNIQEVFDAKKAEIEAIEAKFYKKYARYIQEGSWISEDYVDDTLYFLDGETVLYDSAFPRVQYNISVLELSGLDEYKGYTYAVGDKTFVEDTEFFGYYSKDGVMTPYQEEVVVTEIVNHLDDPTKNTITVQNYKTQFEDLFQRITATTQSLQYSTGSYQRAAGSFYADGTINPTILQNSITQNSINLANARNQSVVWGSDGITTTNLSNPLEVVRIVSGGIYLSNDGGQTFQTGLTAGGVNTNVLTAGTINVDLINVYSGSHPTFSWNKHGISAYAFSQANVYYNTFVRYDQNGIYGIQNGNIPYDWVPQSLNEIESVSRFGLLWDRFYLKSDDNGGMVKISSDEDIQVLDANSAERIKIGRLNNTNETARYGIRIKNANNNVVMETGDDGGLWLRNTLQVGQNSDVPDVIIGRGDTVTDFKGHSTYELINANDNFIVYGDGCVEAQNAEIHGAIYATSGQIGNMTIEEVQADIQNAKRIEIVGSNGLSFKTNNSNVTTPANTTLSLDKIGFPSDATVNSVSWQYSSNLSTWSSLGTGATFNFVYENQKSKFSTNGQLWIKATATIDSVNYTSVIATLQNTVDGAPGTSTVSAILSNEDQMIACDSSGTPKQGAFAEAYTTVTIYEGNTDKTDEWTITYTPSTGVTGSWNSNTHTYTVSGLTTDIGYVLFEFSKTGFNPPVSRKFTLTKVSTGADGTSPTIYTLDVSALAINKTSGSSPTYTPNSLTINCYSQTGDAPRASYASRLRIYTDGGSTPTVVNNVSTHTISPIVAVSSYKIEMCKVGTNDVVDTQTVVITTNGQDGTDGVDGEDGATIWTASAAPTTPNYTFNISSLGGPSGNIPKIGDIIVYSYYRYTISEVSNTTVKAGNRTSIRGAKGEQGEPGENAVVWRIESDTASVCRWISPDSGNAYYSNSSFAFKIYEQTDGISQVLTPNRNLTTRTDGYCYPYAFAISAGGEKFFFVDDPGTEQERLNTRPGYISCIADENLVVVTITQDFPDGGCIVLGTSLVKPTGTSDPEAVAPLVLIQIVNGTSDDLAHFSVHSHDITAAVEEANLVFDSSGLHVNNGAFEIVKTVGGETQQLFYADEFGNLHLVGTIDAQNGVFGGTLNAVSGTFSDVSVGDIHIYEINGEGYITAGAVDSTTGYAPFQVKNDGSILADNISLGSKASIAEYIRIGALIDDENNGWILNPTLSSDISNQNWHETGDVFVIENNGQKVIGLNTNGTLTVQGHGNIIAASHIYVGDSVNSGVVIDGTDSSIHSKNYSSGFSGWKINNSQAEFNDIIARGSIKASVLEYGEVQTVGGQLLVRPSTRIKSNINNILTVEEVSSFNLGDSCIIGTNTTLYTIKFINIDNKTITLKDDNNEITQDFSGKILTSVINADKGDQTTGILLNSTDIPTIGPARSLSMFTSSINEDSGEWVRIPKLVLGDLSGVDEAQIGPISQSYGLYADNVILNGALVSFGTSSGQSSITGGAYFSGINSKSNVDWDASEFKRFFPNATEGGPIILWAGKYDNTLSDLNDNIKSAAFRLDRYGNLFANSAFFKGTIISDSYIEASVIRTAEIIGVGQKEYGLTFRNLSKAFQFVDEVNNQDVQYFTLSNQFVNISQIPLISDNYISAKRLVVSASETNASGFVAGLQDNRIGFISNSNLSNFNTIAQSYISYDGTTFTINENKSNVLKTYESLDTNKIELLNSKQISFKPEEKIVYQNSGGGTLEYIKVAGGYDLNVI